jgi:hypothetical protein
VNIDISFFLDGQQIATRRWSAVPRKGDEVMLGAHGQKEAYKVKRVVWGVEGPDPRDLQAVNIEVVRV